mgnify:CR=1 FL=1
MYNYDWWSFDKDLMLDFNHFLKKINIRSCITLGFIDQEYSNLNRHGEIDHGLGIDVEYFHPTITLDDRMRYIGTIIAQHDMSKCAASSTEDGASRCESSASAWSIGLSRQCAATLLIIAQCFCLCHFFHRKHLACPV